MCKSISPSLSPRPFTTHTICVFFEPPSASLCLKLQVMALFTARKEWAERKGSACILWVFFSPNFIFHVKTQADGVFPPPPLSLFVWRWRGGGYFGFWYMLYTSKWNPTYLGVHLLISQNRVHPPSEARHKYLWGKFVVRIIVSIIKQMPVIWR